MEGDNIVGGPGSYALGVGSRANVIGNAHVDEAYGFKAAVKSSGGPVFGTIGMYKAVCQPMPLGTANSYGLYVADPANSESQVSIGRSSGTAFKIKMGRRHGRVYIARAAWAADHFLRQAVRHLYADHDAPDTDHQRGRHTFLRWRNVHAGLVGADHRHLHVVFRNNDQRRDDRLGFNLHDKRPGDAGPGDANTTTLRINAQRGQSKNVTEWFDGVGNLRVRVNASGNVVTQGTSFFAANGVATTLAEMSGSQGYVRPGTQSGPGARIFSGSGAPNVSAGVSGDFYFRTDTPSTANQRLYVATGANTWTGIL